MKQSLADLATACGASVVVEPERIMYQDNKTPDLLIYMGGRSIAVDVTIKHPLAPTYLPRLALTSLAVAREGE